MTDTKQALSTNTTALATNAAKGITAQKVRNLLISVQGSRWSESPYSSDHALTTDDDVVYVDATGGMVTLTAPAAASNAKKVYTVVKTDSSLNPVKLIGNGGELINGVSALFVLRQFEALTLHCNGTGWVNLSPHSNLPRLYFLQAADQTLANSVAETDLLASAGAKTLYAGLLLAGRRIHIRARGYVSSTGTPTLTLRAKLGGTNITVSAATTLSGVSNVMVDIDVVLTVRSVGVSGSVEAQGRALLGTTVVPMVQTALATVDTTVNNTVSLTGQWSAASSSNTITITDATIEIIN